MPRCYRVALSSYDASLNFRRCIHERDTHGFPLTLTFAKTLHVAICSFDRDDGKPAAGKRGVRPKRVRLSGFARASALRLASPGNAPRRQRAVQRRLQRRFRGAGRGEESSEMHRRRLEQPIHGGPVRAHPFRWTFRGRFVQHPDRLAA